MKRHTLLLLPTFLAVLLGQAPPSRALPTVNATASVTSPGNHAIFRAVASTMPYGQPTAAVSFSYTARVGITGANSGEKFMLKINTKQTVDNTTITESELKLPIPPNYDDARYYFEVTCDMNGAWSLDIPAEETTVSRNQMIGFHVTKAFAYIRSQIDATHRTAGQKTSDSNPTNPHAKHDFLVNPPEGEIYGPWPP